MYKPRPRYERIPRRPLAVGNLLARHQVRRLTRSGTASSELLGIGFGHSGQDVEVTIHWGRFGASVAVANRLEPVGPQEPILNELTVGEGRISNVTTAMWEYEMSGYKIVRRWFARRKRDPDGLLVDVEAELDQLLGDILDGELLTGMWPTAS